MPIATPLTCAEEIHRLQSRTQSEMEMGIQISTHATQSFGLYGILSQVLDNRLLEIRRPMFGDSDMTQQSIMFRTLNRTTSVTVAVRAWNKGTDLAHEYGRRLVESRHKTEINKIILNTLTIYAHNVLLQQQQYQVQAGTVSTSD